jgi:EAL and modified HD-GYP domain-containing signal transduction protein
VLLGDADPATSLEQIGLVAEIGDAIIHRAGLLGALLTLAEAAEDGVQDEAARAMRLVHPELAVLTPPAFAEINLAAAMWAQAHKMA